MNRRLLRASITFLLVLIVMSPLLVGCIATTDVTLIAALPTDTTRPTGTPLPTSTLTAALPTNTVRATSTPLPVNTPAAALPTSTAAPVAQPAGQPAVVVFVKDGNIQAWDEATEEIETIFGSGDAIAVTMSDDGQLVAFLRRLPVKRSELEWYEYLFQQRIAESVQWGTPCLACGKTIGKASYLGGSIYYCPQCQPV